MNFLLRTYSYKFTHWRQDPPNTTGIHSYLESRAGMFPNTVFFGLQYYLKAYLEEPRFTQADIAQADEFCRQHFGDALFNRNGWTRLYEKHHGVLPVRIKAVPEGTVAPLQNVLVTIENTDPEFPWVTNYLPRSMAREEDALHTPPVRLPHEDHFTPDRDSYLYRGRDGERR
jgi:nicotinamide phosphoribosyltransferase